MTEHTCEYVTHWETTKWRAVKTLCGQPAYWRAPDGLAYTYYCDEHARGHVEQIPHEETA